jgi:serine/threonine-protein phosphatase PGAM5
LKKHSTKAKRNLFLIRHGQYNLNGVEADDKILTLLGEEQAKQTGKRLSELKDEFKYTKLHHSTMIRAVQTSNHILDEFKKNGINVKVHVDHMLCEGAPIPPEPPVGHWNPELYVNSY